MCKCQPARFRQVLIANAPRRSQGVYRCRLIEFSSCASHRRSSNANSLCGRNSAGSRKSVRPFKGIFCDDISEFESSHPLSRVWVTAAIYRAHHGGRQRQLGCNANGPEGGAEFQPCMVFVGSATQRAADDCICLER